MACLLCLRECACVSLMDRRGLITPYFLKRQKASGHRFQHTCHTGSPTHSTQTCHWWPSPFPLLDSPQLWPSVTEKCNKLLCYRFWGQMSNITPYLPEWSHAQTLTQGWVFSVQGVDVMSAREREKNWFPFLDAIQVCAQYQAAVSRIDEPSWWRCAGCQQGSRF